MAIIRAKSGNGANPGGLSDGRYRVPDAIIPNADFSGMPSPGSMNALANDPSRNQLLVASRDACIPILYGGPEKLAGKLYIAKIYGSTLYLAQIFCEGQVERIGTTGGETSDRLGIYVNDVDASTYTGIAVHKHLGSASPTADSWLTTVLASESYAETLANTAYLVAEIQAGAFTGVPRITAEVMGRKVYDPRQNLFAGSNDVGNVTYWTVGGSITASKTVAGPYGATNYATSLNDTSNSVASYMTQAVTVANDSATYYVHLKIEKGSRPTVGINVNLAGGTGVAQTFRFNPSTGSYSGGSNVTVTAITSSWWEVSFSIANNTSGNTSLGVAIYPAIAAAGVLSPDDATATGSNVFCEFQVRKSTIPAGYVETTTTAVNQPTQWSDNPALCLGDFLASSTYGEGRTVDQASLALAAEYCDQMVGATSLANEKRSRMTLLLDSRQPTRSWRDILRAYVPCWVIIDGDTAYLKVDRAGSSDHTFTASSIDSAELPVLRRSGVQDVPTAVVIRWTDTSVLPWKTVTAEQDTGASPRRVTRIDMPGIRSYSQARRFAIERLNHYSLEDLTGEISVFEDGLKVYPGDIATITDAVGLSAKLVRILGAQDKGHGRWRLRWREYDPAVYSSVVETTPTYPDIAPMDPNDIPVVTGLTVTAERAKESGVWVTRLNVTWDAITDWPYVNVFEVDVFVATTLATGYSWTGDYIYVTTSPGGPWAPGTQSVAWLDFTSGAATDGKFDVLQSGATTVRADMAGSGTGGNVVLAPFVETFITPSNLARTQPVIVGSTYYVIVRVKSKSGAVGEYCAPVTITPTASASYGGTTEAPIYVAASAPAIPVAGTVWGDNSSGFTPKVYDGSTWKVISVTGHTHDASTLSGTTLASGVTASSLTSLGTIASLVATTADINGGTIDGVTIGGASAAAGTFTSLNLAPTGARITGDMSNATITDRLIFQTSTTNGGTTISAMPNGSGTNCNLYLYRGSDPANTDYARIGATGGLTMTLEAGKTGTGTYRDMTFFTGGSERVRIDTSGNVGIGVSPSFPLHAVGASSGTAGDPSWVFYGNYNRERIQIRGGNGGTGGAAPLFQAFSCTGDPTSPSAVLNGAIVGGWQGGGYDGAAWIRSAAMLAYANENWSTTARGTQIRWQTTAAGTTTHADRMYLDSTGLGIGVAPSYLLHAYNATNPELRFSDGTVQFQAYCGTGTGSAVLGTVGAHSLILRTNATPVYTIASGAVALTQNATGLGIGVSPSVKLHALGGYRGTSTTEKGLDVQYTKSGGGAFNQGQVGVADILNANQIYIYEDDVAAAGNILYGLYVKHDLSATTNALAGQRIAIEGNIILNDTTANTAAGAGQYVGVAGVAIADANDNGSAGGGGTWRGAIFGGNFYGKLTSNATRFQNVTGAEFNVECVASSSVNYKSGIQIVQAGSDAVQGTNYDAAISISNAVAGTGWKNGLLFSAANGYDPMASTAKLIATADTATVAYGVYFDTYGFDEWGAYIVNANTGAGNSHGAFIQSKASNDATSYILSCNNSGGGANFLVDASTSNPVYLMVGGTLKQVVAGANDSGGTGYKVLRVTN